ncbi:hypothetical protein C0995_000964, partial [Termitomyces sp. Mi166
LRNIKSPHKVRPDGLTLPGCLWPLIEEIREAIKKCQIFKLAAYEGFLAKYKA